MRRRPTRTAASPASSPLAHRQRLGIEQQEQVDVRRIVELVAAKLAHGDNGKTPRIGIRHSFRDCGAHRLVDRLVGKIGQQPGNASSENSPARSPRATASASPCRCRRSGCRSVAPLAADTSAAAGSRALRNEILGDVRMGVNRFAQEGRVIARANQRIAPAPCKRSSRPIMRPIAPFRARLGRNFCSRESFPMQMKLEHETVSASDRNADGPPSHPGGYSPTHAGIAAALRRAFEAAAMEPSDRDFADLLRRLN